MLSDPTFPPAVLMPMGIGLSRTSEKGGSRKEHPKVDGKEDGEGGREEADEHRTINRRRREGEKDVQTVRINHLAIILL